MSILISIYDFFSTQLGLLIVGSVLIPIMFGAYARYNKILDDKFRKKLLTRIIIYRYDLLDNACDNFRFEKGLNIIRGNSDGGTETYTPMIGDIEDKTNIFGLIMNALNENELKKKAIPQSIRNLTELTNVLKKLTSDEKSKNYNYNIKNLVCILNELIIDKEKFKEDFYRQNFIGISVNYVRRQIFHYKRKIASLKAVSFKSHIGYLIVSNISLRKFNRRPGYHFNKKYKFYYDANNNFSIEFPSNNWSASDQILFKILNDENIAFVLLNRFVHDYQENINVSVCKRKYNNVKTSFEENIKDYIDVAKKKNEKMGYNLVEEIKEVIKLDKKTESAILELYPLEKNKKNYYQIQRFIMGSKKDYIITATFDEENCKDLKDDLKQIFNSFIIIE
jgi:hypothetical protein